MKNIIEYTPRPRLRKKDTLGTTTKKTVKSLIVTLGVMIAVLAVFSFLLTNHSAQKGYTLQQQETKNKHLREIQTGLDAKIVDSTAFTNLEEIEKITEMRKIEEKNFVTKEDNEVE